VTGNRRVLKRLRHSGRALLATLLVGAGMSASIAPAGASHGIFAPAVNYGTGTFPQSVTAGGRQAHGKDRVRPRRDTERRSAVDFREHEQRESK